MKDKDGSIQAGGASQNLFPAYEGPRLRRGFFVQNKSNADLYVSVGKDAVVGQGIKIPAGALYETPYNACPASEVNVSGAAAGQEFCYGEW